MLELLNSNENKKANTGKQPKKQRTSKKKT